jgi:hypothetical protein
MGERLVSGLYLVVGLGFQLLWLAWFVYALDPQLVLIRGRRECCVRWEFCLAFFSLVEGLARLDRYQPIWHPFFCALACELSRQALSTGCLANRAGMTGNVAVFETRLLADSSVVSLRASWTFPVVFLKRIAVLPLLTETKHHLVSFFSLWISGQGILDEFLV